MGANDIAIAAMMGPKWRPGATWPMEFVYALERKIPWRKEFLSHFCFYFLWRRMRKGPPRSHFSPPEGEIPREACQENLKNNYRDLVKEARDMGIKTACAFYAPAADYDLDPRDQRRAASIQANWRETLETRTSFDLELMRIVKEDICPELDLPFIDLYSVFKRHPKRFEVYFDLAHWNQRGMLAAAQTFWDEIDKLGWWDAPEA